MSQGYFGDSISVMKRRSIKLLVIILMGWYFVGPLVEFVDWWDGPRAEVFDIARCAGGLVTFAVAGFAFAVLLVRKWRERRSSLARVLRGYFVPFNFYLPIFAGPIAPASSHSPPLLPLRI